MDRTCQKCGKVCRYPSDLKSLLARKTPCTPIVERHELSTAEQAKPIPCRFCGHRFTTPQGLSRHLKGSCKIAGSEEGLEKLYEHTLKKQLADQAQQMTQMQAAMQQQTQMVAAMQQQMQAMVLATPAQAAVPQQVNNGQVAHTINNAPVITINVFGGEKLGHIGTSQVKALLDATLQSSQSPLDAATQALIRAATLIYSDPDHPENLTCYIPNKKRDEVMVHGTTGWEIQSGKVVLPPMATRSCDVLFDKQPVEDAARYGDLMKALRDNEEALTQGKEVSTILVRNKALLEAALGALPH